MNAVELRRLFRRVLSKARQREDESAGTRSLAISIDRVPCVAVFKVRLEIKPSSAGGRIEGECMAYVSCAESHALVSGFGWLRFGIAARSAWRDEPVEALFEWALRDARAELELRPEFTALRERSALADCVPTQAPSRPPTRRRAL